MYELAYMIYSGVYSVSFFVMSPLNNKNTPKTPTTTTLEKFDC